MFFFLQAEDGIRDLVRSRGLGDVYKRQTPELTATPWDDVFNDGSLTLTPKITLKPYDYMVLRKLTTLN